MKIWGQLGNIKFSGLFTPENGTFERTIAGNIATQKILGGFDVVEKTGDAATPYRMRISLSSSFREDIRADIADIEEAIRTGEPQLLAIGDEIFDEVIVESARIIEQHTISGKITGATIDISMRGLATI